MTHHHQLARQLLSLSLARRTISASWTTKSTPTVFNYCFVSSKSGTLSTPFRLTRPYSNLTTNSTATTPKVHQPRVAGSKGAKTPKKQQRPGKPVRDELRRRQLNHPSLDASAPELSRVSNAYQGSKQKVVWDDAMDAKLLQLSQSRIPWREIDLQMGLPYSASHHRFHTVLDPNLKSWLLPNGQVNEPMIKYLMYLRDDLKVPYADISRLELMREPWLIPDTNLEASIEAAQGDWKEMKKKKSIRDENNKKDTFLSVHKVALVHKYLSYKAQENRIKRNKESDRLLEAVRRGVELYGENWTRVAAHANQVMQKQMQVNRSSTSDDGDHVFDSTPTSTSPAALEPEQAEYLYKKSVKQGNQWGLEDDLVMARRILELSVKWPGVQWTLSQPWDGTGSSNTIINAVERQQKLENDSSNKNDDDNNDAAKVDLWEDLAMTLGNHSPIQCKRRWDDLRLLDDNYKFAQTDSWHRFERLQFWMVWSYLITNENRGRRMLREMRKNGPTKIITLGHVADRLRTLSLSNDVSRWMRHRSQDECEHHFLKVVNQTLNLRVPVSILFPYRDATETDASDSNINDLQRQLRQQSPMWQPLFGGTKTMAAVELLELILERVAKPIQEKVSMISGPNALSTRNDPKQQIVRSNWTAAKIKTLQQLVLEQKHGVLVPNSELDWIRIAQQLEHRFKNVEDDPYPQTILNARQSHEQEHILLQQQKKGVNIVVDGKGESGSGFETESKKSTDQKLSSSQAVSVKKQLQETERNVMAPIPSSGTFSPAQCKTCWEYISAHGSLSGRSIQATKMQHIQKNHAGGSGSDNENASSLNDGTNQSEYWTDLEIELLKRGVRRHGTNWADVRAQFLPRRDVSDLYQKWKAISVAPLASASTSAASSAPTLATKFALSSFLSPSLSSSSTSTSATPTSDSDKVDRLSDPDYLGLLRGSQDCTQLISEEESENKFQRRSMSYAAVVGADWFQRRKNLYSRIILSSYYHP
ncbi:hypothetical protein BGZ83_008473 [Gryganskiella cystojenkinii]|nr:hypothetical protein BGZ83_008473 [Gryganskiella cystojenkinii]